MNLFSTFWRHLGSFWERFVSLWGPFLCVFASMLGNAKGKKYFSILASVNGPKELKKMKKHKKTLLF